jgi:uncharacterized protein (TIGR02246 family)
MGYTAIMKKLSFVIVALFLLSSCTEQINRTEEGKAVVKVLMDQQDAWNETNLEGYLDGYWDNEKVRFVTNSKILNGLDEIREMYQKGYDSPEKFGVLTFDIQVVDVLSADLAMVVGKYQLKRENEKRRVGRFTLLFRKINGEWKVIQDHTS